MQEIFIKEEYIKLDSALKFSGVLGTGGQAKMVILDGLVKVNDEVCLIRGKKLRRGDTFEFENQKFIINNEC